VWAPPRASKKPSKISATPADWSPSQNSFVKCNPLGLNVADQKVMQVNGRPMLVRKATRELTGFVLEILRFDRRVPSDTILNSVA